MKTGFQKWAAAVSRFATLTAVPSLEHARHIHAAETLTSLVSYSFHKMLSNDPVALQSATLRRSMES
jgi:hypothetical protein